MDAHMVHGNAHDDRFCVPVPVQMPTVTANTMNAKHIQPGLATQAQAEPWQSLAEHGPQHCATAHRGGHSTQQRSLSSFTEAAAISPTAVSRPSG